MKKILLFCKLLYIKFIFTLCYLIPVVRYYFLTSPRRCVSSAVASCAKGLVICSASSWLQHSEDASFKIPGGIFPRAYTYIYSVHSSILYTASPLYLYPLASNNSFETCASWCHTPEHREMIESLATTRRERGQKIPRIFFFFCFVVEELENHTHFPALFSIMLMFYFLVLIVFWIKTI